MAYDAAADEARRLRAEISTLNLKISRAKSENNNLGNQLENIIRSIEILAQNVNEMGVSVDSSLRVLANKIQDADTGTFEVFKLIEEVTASYFSFKNLSTASKNLSQFTDEYYTRFSFFNELRRITLGYVIGLDAHICSDEIMRKKVEKSYLKNTEYWLAYGIMATMLWASDEEEAAKRAMSKALSMDYFSTSLYFLLINLRFTRVDAAKKWYLCYLERVDMDNLDEEWKYLLEAYLSGVFGVDKEFQSLVGKCFTDMFESLESMHPNYGDKIIDKTKEFADSYIHVTEREFENLRRNCTEYDEMKRLLSEAEKNTQLAIHFKKILEDKTEIEKDLFQRIENILYNLINSYDKEEYKVIKNIRYSEMVIKAKGDIGIAQNYYNSAYGTENQKNSIDDLLFKWAFIEDESRVNINVRKFSISYINKWINKGFEKFADCYRQKEKEKYIIEIDGCKVEGNESSYEELKKVLVNHYNKNRMNNVLKDKYVWIFAGMVFAALLILGTMIVLFNKIALVIGILLGLVGGFLLWRRMVDVSIILRKKQEDGCLILKKTLQEIGQWRKFYQLENAKNSDLLEVFSKINL